MDWIYLIGPSAFQIAAGFVIAKLFDQLSETRQDRRLKIQLEAERERLNLQLAAEKERLGMQQRAELRKRIFDSKFDTALRLTRMLKGSVQTLRTQMLLHGASYSEGQLDVESFRQLRDTTFDDVHAAIREGHDAAAVMDLLFHGISFADLAHHRPLVEVAAEWQMFLRRQAEFGAWLDSEMQNLPQMLPKQLLAEKNAEVSQQMQDMRSHVARLVTLTDAYDDGVSKTIRMLAAELHEPETES